MEGLERSPIEILAASKKGPMPSSQTALALAEIYDTTMGIYNHGDDVARAARPLALVELHPKEDTTTYSPLYRRIAEFHNLKVAESWGLSLVEFLNLPHEYVEYILKLTRRAASVSGKQASDALRAMERESGV